MSKWADEVVDSGSIEAYVGNAKNHPEWPKEGTLALLVIELPESRVQISGVTRQWLADFACKIGWTEEELHPITKAPLLCDPILFCGMDDHTELAYMSRSGLTLNKNGGDA